MILSVKSRGGHICESAVCVRALVHREGEGGREKGRKGGRGGERGVGRERERERETNTGSRHLYIGSGHNYYN